MYPALVGKSLSREALVKSSCISYIIFFPYRGKFRQICPESTEHQRLCYTKSALPSCVNADKVSMGDCRVERDLQNNQPNRMQNVVYYDYNSAEIYLPD